MLSSSAECERWWGDTHFERVGCVDAIMAKEKQMKKDEKYMERFKRLLVGGVLVGLLGTKNPVCHRECWWWNEYTQKAVKEKRSLYVNWDKKHTVRARKAYCKLRAISKKVTARANNLKLRS